jgi:hypothetical protein
MSNELDDLIQGHRRRLLAFEAELRALKDVRVELSEAVKEAQQIVDQLKAVCKVCSRLNILCTTAGETKGPQKGNRNRENGQSKVRFIARR